MFPTLKKRLANPVNIIVLFALLQTLSATYFLRIGQFHAANSILFLLSGAGISFFLLRIPVSATPHLTLINKQLLPKLLILLVLLPISYQLSKQILDTTPIEKEYADMLPVIKVMGTRFLNGDLNTVHDPIPEIWDGFKPRYLPALWIPFTPSLVFKFDMRWITVSGIWLSVLLCVLPVRWKFSVRHIFFALSILVLLAWLHFDKVNNVIRLTEEGVIFFYFSLLTISIISGNPWLVGITAVLCLLSRYSMIGWIPFAVLYLLSVRQFNYLWKAAASGAAVILVLVILPFGLEPLQDQLQLPSAYIVQADKVWKEYPEFFYKSPGMAKFFGPDHVQLLHSILLWGSFIVPLAFFFLIKRKTVPSNIALLAGFQLSITFFYSFLDVSYLYLYYTPVFVSLIIAGWIMMTKTAFK
jgi:hypothetical protein